jgi:hypothetical protein
MSLAAGYAMKKRGAKCMAHGAEACADCYAKGGEAKPASDEGEEGIVDRIMKRFSKPSMGGDDAPIADGESADFDYLDQMPAEHDADYTGANSGDEIGNEDLDKAEDEDESMVGRIMKKRRQHNPVPA